MTSLPLEATRILAGKARSLLKIERCPHRRCFCCMMDDLLREAKAIFEPEVLRAIEGSQFEENDIEELTQDDINLEFKQLSFGRRKKIWNLFRRFKKTQTPINYTTKECDISPTDCTSTEDDYFLSSTTTTTRPSDDSVFEDSAGRLSDVDPHTADEPSTPRDSDNSTTSSGGTEPVHDLSYYSEQNTRNVKHKVRSKTFKQLQFPPLSPIKTRPDANYPGGIPSPFPFEEKFKVALNTTRSAFTAPNNYPVFLKVIQKIHDISLCYLRHKPTKAERKRIEKKLCLEYPVLSCGAGGYKTLMYALRKRANNVEKRTNEKLEKNSRKVAKKRPPISQKDVPPKKRRERMDVLSPGDATQTFDQPFTGNDLPMTKTFPIACSSPAESSEDDNFLSRRKAILDMDGAGITTKVLALYPEYKYPLQCMTDYAELLGADVKTVIENARMNWNRFVTATLPDDEEIISLEAVHRVLLHVWGVNATRSVLVVSDCGQLVSLSCNQPYLFSTSLTGPKIKASVISDKIPMTCITVSNSNAFMALLLLVSIYYILSLEYPPLGRNALGAVAWILSGREGEDPPGGKFVEFSNFEHNLL